MSDAFNDDLSADMTDPEFAAEFERTTDEVRRERYAAAIAAADDMRKDWCYAEADAAMALADEEIGGLAQELVEMGGDLSARRREGDRLVKLNRDLRSDLQESADALDESAQLLEDALNENERLRAELAYEELGRQNDRETAQITIDAANADNERLLAELEDARRVSDQWAKAHGARSAETSIARDENERLRAELARARQRLVLADEFAKEHSCLTPEYTEGPCHCVHGDPYSIERDNNRLRAELEDMTHDAERWADAASKDAVARLDAESTIARVRAVLDTADVSDRETGFFQDVRDALDGENQ